MSGSRSNLAVAAAFAAATLAAPAARAAEFRDFDRATFVQAQAQGRPILVDVAAWWCPVCLQQNGKIKSIAADPAYRDLLVLKINYDKQKDEWRSFGVTKQATLIAFHGARETGRLQYRVNKAEIAGVIAATGR